MTHEVLPHVVDEACPDGSKDGAGRLLWQLALLSELYVIHLSCMYSCG